MDQGCQIFLGPNIPNWEKYDKRPLTIPNGHKLYQMAIKYSNGHKIYQKITIQSASKIYPKLGFLV
jgi:hypothetical protein